MQQEPQRLRRPGEPAARISRRVSDRPVEQLSVRGQGAEPKGAPEVLHSFRDPGAVGWRSSDQHKARPRSAHRDPALVVIALAEELADRSQRFDVIAEDLEGGHHRNRYEGSGNAPYGEPE